jgi:hypothetical protein
MPLYKSGKPMLTASRFALHFLILMLAVTLPVSAAQPQAYDVEIVIFSHKSPATQGEKWSGPVKDNASPGFFPDNNFTELDGSVYQLNNLSYGLRHSSGYAVLFHKAWRQVAYDRNRAVAYPVHSSANTGRYSIEGTVKLVRERYLHLDVDLLMSTQGDSGARFQLREKRRIKSNTVHYFDHPRFGIIANVTPYLSPEAALENVEEVVETVETEAGSAEDAARENEESSGDNQLTR